MSVSVVITCHDEGRTIEQAVRSVDAQTIFDRVLENHRRQRRLAGWVANLARGAGYKSRQAQSSSKRLAWERQAHVMLGYAKPEGLFIALLDGDDFWAPEKLAQPASGVFTAEITSGWFIATSLISVEMMWQMGGSLRFAALTRRAHTSFEIIFLMMVRSCRRRPFSDVSY